MLEMIAYLYHTMPVQVQNQNLPELSAHHNFFHKCANLALEELSVIFSSRDQYSHIVELDNVGPAL